MKSFETDQKIWLVEGYLLANAKGFGWCVKRYCS